MTTRKPWGALRILSLFFCVIGIPLVLLVVLPLQLATESLTNELTTEIATTSSIAGSAVGQQIASASDLVAAYTQQPGLVDPNSKTMANVDDPTRVELREIVRANPNISRVLILDSAGRMKGMEPWVSPTLGADLSFRPYFSEAIKQSRPYVSSAFLSMANPPRKIVTVSNVIRAEDSSILGVIVVLLDVTPQFQRYVDDFQRNHGVTLTIFDQDANIVARPGDMVEVIPSNDVHVVGDGRAEKWSGEVKVDGKSVLASYTPIPSVGWSVSASVDKSSAFQPVSNLRSAVLAIVGILAIAILCAFVWLGRSLRSRDLVQVELQASEHHNRQIVETAAQAYFELDARGAVVKWNHQAERVFGWGRDEIAGQRLIDVVIAHESREQFEANVSALFDDDPSTPDQVVVESFAIRQGSVERIAICSTMWATTSNGVSYLSAFVQDVSEQKRLDQEQDLIVKRQRLLVEELRQADKVKSDFISTISHELRTPLTSIVGYLEMMSDGFGGDLTEQQISMLDVVDRNSRRLLGLIDDVLTLSRIESGVLRVNNVEIDVANLIVGVQQALFPSAVERQLAFSVDVAPDTGKVVGDPNQLERVLLNLLSNAVKFTPDGGRVTLSASRSDNIVRIAVADTGIGIPDDEQANLFNRFFRASSAQDHAIQGTGLGLTIVKSIVERHGGTISVRSTLNVGTTVTVELPSAHTDHVLHINAGASRVDN